SATGLEHPLDEVADLIGGQDGRREFRDPSPGDEDLSRFVDPDLFDRRVVEVLLQRPVTRNDGEDRVDCGSSVSQLRQTSVERALVIVLDRVLNESTNLPAVARRVETGASDQFPDLVLDLANR